MNDATITWISTVTFCLSEPAIVADLLSIWGHMVVIAGTQLRRARAVMAAALIC